MLVRLSLWPTHPACPGPVRFPPRLVTQGRVWGHYSSHRPHPGPGPEAGHTQSLLGQPPGLSSRAPSSSWLGHRTKVCRDSAGAGGMGRAGLPASHCLGLALSPGATGSSRSSRPGREHLPTPGGWTGSGDSFSQVLWLSRHVSAPAEWETTSSYTGYRKVSGAGTGGRKSRCLLVPGNTTGSWQCPARTVTFIILDVLSLYVNKR